MLFSTSPAKSQQAKGHKLTLKGKGFTSDARHALDPVLFAEELLRLELDDWQKDVLSSTGKRDLLNITRQGGKSTVAAILGLHESLYKPNSLTLIVSPSDRQSAELFRKLVTFRDLLPRQPELLENTKRSMTVRGGGRVASLPGSEATIRGFSAATLIVEDEAARVEDALYLAIRPMLATSNGRLMLMSTPFGKRGHFWEAWDSRSSAERLGLSSSGTSWRKVRVPATEVPRISPQFLEEERAEMGSWWFSQEYLCEFVETDDTLFRDEYLQAALSDELEPLRFGREATSSSNERQGSG